MGRVGKLRIVYGLALTDLAVVLMTVLFDVGSVAKLVRISLPLLLYEFYVLGFLLFAVPLVFLFWRPMAWGRLALPFYGFGWIMHGAALALKRAPVPIVGLSVEITCGAVMIALAIAHQLIELRSFRTQPS